MEKRLEVHLMMLTSVLFSIDMDKLCGVKKEERKRIQATMEEVRQSLYDNFPLSGCATACNSLPSPLEHFGGEKAVRRALWTRVGGD